MADKFWWKNDPAVKAALQGHEDKERSATREATKALDKAHADSQEGKRMSDRKIVGWFYRNGKRIPIFEKSGKKPNKVSGKTINDLNRETEKARGVILESADDAELRHRELARRRNGDRVELYGISPKGYQKKESATFNMYFDGDKELINFRREPDPESLRRNVKISGKNNRPKRTGIDIETRVNDDIGKNPEAYGITGMKKHRTVRRGEGKLTPYYYDSKLGQYHTGEKFNSDAVNADIKDQTRSRTTEHTTTRKARVRSARRKK